MKISILFLSSLLATLCIAEESFVLFDFENVKEGALPPGIEVLNGADDAGSVTIVSSKVVGSQSLQLIGDMLGSDGRGYRSMAAIKLSGNLILPSMKDFRPPWHQSIKYGESSSTYGSIHPVWLFLNLNLA